MAFIERISHYWRQGRFVLPLTLLIVFIAVLPNIIFRDFTPSNELRYLSIADESLASGRWWAFTNHGIPYADKPPLYIWCVILGKWLLGSHQMWFLSLFSIIPAFVIAWVMYRWTYRLTRPFRTASLLMLFSCGLFAGMVFTLRMDMLMTMFIVLALYQFRRLELSEDKPSVGQRLIFALCIFLAVFSKGPMGILIPLVATTVWLFLTRRMRLWARAWGWPTWCLLILLCAIWFGAVYAEGGTEYLDNLLVHQTVGRAVNSFHHKRPFWYYLVSLTYTTQPWTFLIFGSVVYAVRKFRRADESIASYFLVIILSTFVLLSIISSKLQVYMLPVYPFMVYIAAIVCSSHRKSRLVKAAVAIPAVILGLVAIAEPIVADTEWFAAFGVDIDALPATRYAWCALFTGAFLTLWYLYRKHRLDWAIETLSLTVLALVFIAGFAIREFNADLGYGELCRELREETLAHPDAEIIVWDLDRPENIDVYMEGKPFRIVESTDSVKSLTISKLPTIVATRADRVDMVTNRKYSKPIGRNFRVVVCDSLETEWDRYKHRMELIYGPR